jgi:hypothetical protein
MIGVTTSGSFDNTLKFLRRASKEDIFGNLDSYGERGVRALQAATPKDSGETARSWAYRVVRGPGRVRIEWYNTHVEDGTNIAIILQYGHGTGTGGWVEGRDYINPAMRPVFDTISKDILKEVRR